MTAPELPPGDGPIEYAYNHTSNMDPANKTYHGGIMNSDEKLKRALADNWEFVGDPWQLCHVLRAELLSVMKDRDERAVQKGHFFAAIETLRDEKDAIKNEVAVVLMMLDELAELWGDEGKFRTCRDRLRKLLPIPK